MKHLSPIALGRRNPISLSEYAYITVRARILKGEIPLGSPLSRRKLATELGVSLLPMAEALQRLENEGLVESRPRVGTRVFHPTVEEIRERYAVREALESQAARLFAERATAREKLELEDMALRMDALFNQCFNSPGPDRDFLYAVHSYHSEFHLKIAEVADCRALYQTIENNQVLTFTWVFDTAAERPPLPPKFHRELVKALSQGDPKVADAAMRQHIRYAQDTVARTAGSEWGQEIHGVDR